MIPALFLCASAIALDGSTLSCRLPFNERPAFTVRLEGVEPAAGSISRDVLTYLLGQLDGKKVWCLTTGDGRARCSVDGRDLGETLVGFGLARRP
jgi:endonuclease YncB( thermonuclease family)